MKQYGFLYIFFLLHGSGDIVNRHQSMMQVKKLSINQAVGKLTASQDNTAEIYSVGNSIGIRYYDSDYDSLRNKIIQECLNFDQQGKMTRINNLWVTLEQPSQWQVLCGQGPQIRIHTVYFKKRGLMNLEVYTSSYKNPFEKDNSIRSKILTGAGLAIAACAQYYLGTIYKQ